jgi:Domain of unknown function (DUF4276)
VTLTIIVEGGSKGNASVEKKGFSQLFGKVCRVGEQPRVKLAGSRIQAMKAFLAELEAGREAVLLIDSEEPCDHPTGRSYLMATIPTHGIHEIGSSHDDDVHLMVQVMESWFFADPEGVRSRVMNLDVSKLANELNRRDGNVELIPKDDAQRLFAQACGGRYKKVHHLEFIGRISPEKLATASVRAAALFRRLRGETPVWP